MNTPQVPASTDQIIATPDQGPFSALPRIPRRLARARNRLLRSSSLSQAIRNALESRSLNLKLGPPELLGRASGLQRPGVVAQFLWGRLNTRVGLALDPALAHAVVDTLLGYDRPDAEAPLAVSPVEWGVLSYLVANLLDQIAETPGPLSPWDLILDRLGPEPFSLEGLGSVVTLVWPARIAQSTGTIRLWLPESLLALALMEPDPQPPPILDLPALRAKHPHLAASGRFQAGAIRAAGLSRIRVGAVLPIEASPLRGTPDKPVGRGLLVFDAPPSRFAWPAELDGTQRAQLLGPVSLEAIPMPSADILPTDVPVTLVVELGRVSLPLSRLADLKPGEFLELSRHSREPVELTSGGKTVARGELVLIEDELAVKISHVFL